MRRPIGVLKTTMYETITSRKLSQIIRLRLPIAGPRKCRPEIHGSLTFGIVETPLRDVVAVVELEEEVAGDPEREEVDRRAADDLVGPQVDREERVARAPAAPPAAIADERARRPSCRPCRRRRRPRTRPSASSPRGRCSRRRCARRTCRRSRRRRAASRTRTSARSATASKTTLRLPTLERVARSPRPIPSTPGGDGPEPEPALGRGVTVPDAEHDGDDPDDDRPDDRARLDRRDARGTPRGRRARCRRSR